MRKITLLPLALSLCAAAALAEDPQLPPAMQLAAEAKALCEAQKTQTVADCVRETLGDAGIESVQQALA
ncbi:MAG TPA: hypothetical protein VFY12_10235, partial [Arenimonas sp.]|nr:hypothetical protein [Arenimonas sp.]